MVIRFMASLILVLGFTGTAFAGWSSGDQSGKQSGGQCGSGQFYQSASVMPNGYTYIVNPGFYNDGTMTAAFCQSESNDTALCNMLGFSENNGSISTEVIPGFTVVTITEGGNISNATSECTGTYAAIICK
jgi:hypothetical protein